MEEKAHRARREDIVHPLRLPEPHQPRSSLGVLASWWLTSGSGLVVVSGIAGCGKTAFAAEFLESIRPAPGSESGRNPPAPDVLFVFSFREVADPEICLTRLRDLLPEPATGDTAAEGAGAGDQAPARTVAREGTSSTDPPPGQPPSDDELLDRLDGSSGRILIVLDGLDTVQVPNQEAECTTWEIENPGLRKLVQLVASGNAPNTVVLITTRLPLNLPGQDAGASSAGLSILPIDLDRFEARADSIHYLRLRQVPFSDALLGEAAATCADHPLALAAFVELGPHPALGLPALDSSLFRWPAGPATLPGGAREALLGMANEYFGQLQRYLPGAFALLEELTHFERPVAAVVLRDTLDGSALADDAPFEASMRALKDLRLLVEEAMPGGRLSIHPVLRFASSPSDSVLERRAAIAEVQLNRLVDTPHGEPPPDPQRLDILEEVLHQSLASGDLKAACRTYSHHLGGYPHLAQYLGDHRRGERVARALLAAALRQGRGKVADSLAHDWLGFLIGLGRLADAEVAFTQLQILLSDGGPLSLHALQIRALLLLHRGRLVEALAMVDEAVRPFTTAHEVPEPELLPLRGRLRTLLGRTYEAAADFSDVSRSSRRLGVEYLQLLARFVPPHDLSAQPTQGPAAGALSELGHLLDQRWGHESPERMRCHVLAAQLDPQSTSAIARLKEVKTWAEVRGIQELACWSQSVQAECRLQRLRSQVHRHEPPDENAMQEAVAGATEGLNIARLCGYGIHYADLLVTRSRLLHLAGQAAAAEADAASALREGLRESKDLGLLEILPLCDRRCGYAWGEASAQQAMAEALLLKASQVWGQPSAAARPPENLAQEFLTAMRQARIALQACMERRDALGDPLLDDTKRVLEDLGRGKLGRPVVTFSQPPQLNPAPPIPEDPLVFISYHSLDRDGAREIVEALERQGIRTWFDQDQLLAGDHWLKALEHAIQHCDAAVVAVGPSGFGPWHRNEVYACLVEMNDQRKRLAPLLLPNARKAPPLPLFLKTFHYLDMINGITEDKLRELVVALRTPPLFALVQAEGAS